jgi:hypothetical protein
VQKTIGITFLVILLVGCESSSSISKVAPVNEQKDETLVVVEETQQIEAVDSQVISPELAILAEEKYRLASQLLDFAGPIEDLSTESKNVRWLAADMLHTAVNLDPTEFKYYRDLFMIYMILQEPVKAMEAIESAVNTPSLAEEVAEFQSLVFGALEYASLIKSEG